MCNPPPNLGAIPIKFSEILHWKFILILLLSLKISSIYYLHKFIQHKIIRIVIIKIQLIKFRNNFEYLHNLMFIIVQFSYRLIVEVLAHCSD